MAQEEPATVKVLYKIGRILTGIGDVILTDGLKGVAYHIKGKEGEQQVKDFRQKLYQRLNDATLGLKEMKAARRAV